MTGSLSCSEIQSLDYRGFLVTAEIINSKQSITRKDTKIMNKKEILAMAEKSAELGITKSERTREALAELENPHYTITLTGEFQVGKSTLLNKVVLGSDVLLQEGKGLATTAIPTKLVHAPQKELTVIYCDPTREPAHFFGDAVTPELLRTLTTAQGEEARLALAREIRHVILGVPVEPLRTYTFFDTPGINDPNTELIERTTAETLPESDIVLYVVDATRPLPADAKCYLSRAVFANGMSRAMVLASYNPKFYKSAEERVEILDNIRAQLASIGRNYVPVFSYTYDPEVDGDILHGPAEILGTILDYLAKNRDASKIDKAAYRLVGDAVAYAEALKAKIEVSGKGKEEIASIEKKIESTAINLDAQYNQTLNEFSLEFADVQSASATELRDALLKEDDANSAINVFMAQFDGITDANSLKKQIEPAVASVAPVVQSKMAECATNFSAELRKVLEHTSENVTNAVSRISISTDFKPSVSGGWMGKINPTLLKGLEIGVAVILGGPIFGIVTAFLDKIPFIQSVLPHTHLTAMIVSQLKKSFKESLAAAYQGQLQQMEDAASTIKDAIKDTFSDIYRERISPYQDAIKTKSVLSPEELENTKALIKKIDAFSASVTA